jgi:hypothetical protein
MDTRVVAAETSGRRKCSGAPIGSHRIEVRLLHLRPLGPGRYQFIGEFNEATAQSVIIAEYGSKALGSPLPIRW